MSESATCFDPGYAILKISTIPKNTHWRKQHTWISLGIKYPGTKRIVLVDTRSPLSKYGCVLADRSFMKLSFSMPWSHMGELQLQLYSSLTAAVCGGEWLTSRPGRLISGKINLVPIEQDARWAPETVWHFCFNVTVQPQQFSKQKTYYLYCSTVHLVDSLNITQPTNALIVCHLF